MQLSPNLPAVFEHTLRTLLDDSSPQSIAVALSGGADSRALALLAQTTDAHIHALIVDHGLRDASADEAAQTAAWAQAHGITPHIITLALTRDANAIQERARAARYEAMISACKRIGVQHLLLGQHADDQIETILFRLLRGSGIYGLAGMSAKREQQGVWLLRPLLHIPKSALKTYLRERSEDWIEDPSNTDTQFARVRLRQFLAHHATPNQRLRIHHFGEQCGHIRAADEVFLQNKLSTFAQCEHGIATLKPAFFSEPPEHAIWMLRRLLITLNGNIAMPRQHEVARLYADLIATPDKPRTLHSCLIFKHKEHFIICREAARVAPTLAVKPHSFYRWDHRFDVETGELPADCNIAPLGERGWAEIKKHTHIPHRAALSLLALWHLEQLVCVPHIDYNASHRWKNALTIRFSPAKALAAAPFFLMNGGKII